MTALRSLLFLCAVAVCTAAAAPTIKHVIVLMEENRSFDHLLGFRGKGVNGLTGKEFNYVSVTNPELGKIYVQMNASNIAQCDPVHDFPGTTLKIFGRPDVEHNNFTTPTMSGFVAFERHEDIKYKRAPTDFCEVMNAFDPAHLPVTNALADEFVLMDEFFASMPGPTWPGRLFHLCGTSGGLTETSLPWFKGVTGALFPQRTIFDQVSAAGLQWRNYVNDTPWELMLESIAHHPEHVLLLDSFYADAAAGTLPSFGFINPRAGINATSGLGSNDQHPDHDVALGEALIKDVYEALRSGPAWNETLFIVTYDEHGGFYDHVKPPTSVPPPDDIPSYPDKFGFDRGGIRIPTLLISPWVAKGRLVSAPDAAAKPAPNSVFELTSIMASVRRLLGITEGPLTKRDAWAATFDYVLNLTEPRTDCPMHLPDPMPPTLSVEQEAERHVNDLQKHHMEVHAEVAGLPYPHHIEKQRDVSEWLQGAFQHHARRTASWKASKSRDHKLSAFCEPFLGESPNYAAYNWSVFGLYGASTFQTVAAQASPKNDSTLHWYCLDAGEGPIEEGTVVTVSRCYPSRFPQRNRDRAQHWHVTPGTNIKPRGHPHLCLTNACVDPGLEHLKSHVTLERCNNSLAQHWGYQGPAPGNEPNSSTGEQGLLMEGDAIYSLVIDWVHDPSGRFPETDFVEEADQKTGDGKFSIERGAGKSTQKKKGKAQKERRGIKKPNNKV